MPNLLQVARPRRIDYAGTGDRYLPSRYAAKVPGTFFLDSTLESVARPGRPAKLDISKLASRYYSRSPCLSLSPRLERIRALVSISSTKLVTRRMSFHRRSNRKSERQIGEILPNFRRCDGRPASILLSTRNSEPCKTSYNEIFDRIHSLSLRLFIPIFPNQQFSLSLSLILSPFHQDKGARTHTYYLVKTSAHVGLRK